MVVSRQRVLVVEDDEVIRALVAEALTEEGYETREAGDGSQGLEALAGAWRPDLILLDLMMPVMDGWTFRAEQCRREGIAAIPVVIMSAAHDAADHAEQLQAAAVFVKPFDLDVLLDTVQQLID